LRTAPAPLRVLAVIISTLLFAVCAAGAWAVTDDFHTREILPPGSMIEGVSVAGLSRAEAIERVSAQVAVPLFAPITVLTDASSTSLEPRTLASIDVEALVDEALRPRTEQLLARRVTDRALAAPIGVSLDVTPTIDGDALVTWLGDLASTIDTPALDASLTIEGRELSVIPSEPGLRVDRGTSLARLRDAVSTGAKRVWLDVETVEPTITEDNLGKAIVVTVGDRSLRLYDNGKLVKTYGVAVGTPSHPTPLGSFKIVLKRYMPTWVNPGSAWAADMPRVIPAGPSNPLGTRALNIDSPGIRIHGTTKDSSIGTAASHGCMRMHRADIEDLYDRVEVNTPVWIVK
jgi:lipoprotein-anchoring transpeptidase ErfK/SrfK